MKVTLDHPEAKHGYPVILDDEGAVMKTHEGIEAILDCANLTPARFAAFCDIAPGTLRLYGRTTITPANVLNMLQLVLENPTLAHAHAQAKSLKLSAAEKKVLALLKAKKTYDEIAEIIGVSRQRVQQILSAANGKQP